MNTCIYHAHCADGFGAAWAVHRAFEANNERCNFFPATYNEPPPDITGKHVFIVDFSYPRETILQMAESAQSVTVIDHHATAITDLEGLTHPNLKLVLSKENSGAVLTWRYFFPGINVPKLLQYIEDRDLWIFRFSETKAVLASLYSYEFDFDVWATLDSRKMIHEGVALLRNQDKLVRSITERPARKFTIGGHTVAVANCPPNLASEVGNLLCKTSDMNHLFAATYIDTDNHRVFSLRSSKMGLDVSLVAKQYGGGGHKNAAGFRVSFSDLLKNNWV